MPEQYRVSDGGVGIVQIAGENAGKASAEFRAAMGWGRERLAQKVGVGWQTIYNWERRGQVPHPKHLAALKAVILYYALRAERGIPDDPA